MRLTTLFLATSLALRAAAAPNGLGNGEVAAGVNDGPRVAQTVEETLVPPSSWNAFCPAENDLTFANLFVVVNEPSPGEELIEAMHFLLFKAKRTIKCDLGNGDKYGKDIIRYRCDGNYYVQLSIASTNHTVGPLDLWSERHSAKKSRGKRRNIMVWIVRSCWKRFMYLGEIEMQTSCLTTTQGYVYCQQNSHDHKDLEPNVINKEPDKTMFIDYVPRGRHHSDPEELPRESPNEGFNPIGASNSVIITIGEVIGKTVHTWGSRKLIDDDGSISQDKKDDVGNGRRTG